MGFSFKQLSKSSPQSTSKLPQPQSGQHPFEAQSAHGHFETEKSNSNLATQLDQASSFGHHLSQLQTNQSSTPIAQLRSRNSVVQLQKSNKKKNRKTKFKSIPPELDIPLAERLNLNLGLKGLGLDYGQDHTRGRLGVNPINRCL